MKTTKKQSRLGVVLQLVPQKVSKNTIDHFRYLTPAEAAAIQTMRRMDSERAEVCLGFIEEMADLELKRRPKSHDTTSGRGLRLVVDNDAVRL